MHKMRTDFVRILVSTVAVTSLSIGSTAAVAMGLQVSPTSIDLTQDLNATELWLINNSSRFIQAQVRVYAWDQKNKKDVLTATSDLIASPPVAKVSANGRQLVRVMRPKNNENLSDLTTFRIVVNELPVASTKNTGIDFVMEYSIPVFVYNKSQENLKENLKLSFIADGKNTLLHVNNEGGGYAKLYGLNFISINGERLKLNPGLIGYILPNQEMEWEIKKPPSTFSKGGTVELLVNGNVYSEKNIPLRR
ncbi:molecular chaperone [Serratia sp. N21D137]|uniref:fimbrial biogenesis chaperone n=1 Tax=Serratia sp. N21D137 TaxID=3397495 RepID=UPI0039E1D07E